MSKEYPYLGEKYKKNYTSTSKREINKSSGKKRAFIKYEDLM